MSYHPLQVLAEHIPHIAWLASPDGSTEYCNRHCLEYLGLNAKDMTGWNWHWSVHPADLTRVVRSWKFSMRTGEPYHVEYRLRRADGTYRWHLGWALPLRDTAGQLTGWFGTCADIEQVRSRPTGILESVFPKNGC
jgi:PAS domain S-box-containing protein